MKRPVIIDTKLSIDDAAAITIAAGNDMIDIKAVTAVGADMPSVIKGVSALCRKLGVNCIIGSGAGKPVFKDAFDLREIYKGYDITEEDLSCPECEKTEYPWDIIRTEAERAKGELEIITLGPVTNIAITLLRYPEIKPLIKRIFVAAGAGYTGNAAPYSEHNAYCDPDALQIVFDSGVPVTMFPLEAACSCDMSETDEIMYTAKAMEAFVYPHKVETKDYFVVCETRSGENQGWTVVDRLGKYKKEPNISVVTGMLDDNM